MTTQKINERFEKSFQAQKTKVGIYFTAGYPSVDSILPTIKNLSDQGVAMIEIGVPFSDPIADGPTIQKSSELALKNGITLPKLLEILEPVRQITTVPLVMMGYLNPFLQYGLKDFFKKAGHIGIDGLLIPDMPAEWFEENAYHSCLDAGLSPTFLISPDTEEERVRYLDRLTQSFHYLVSGYQITGQKAKMGEESQDFFKRIKNYHLEHPSFVGFGIQNADDVRKATEFADGVIVGTAFIKAQMNDEKFDLNKFCG